MTYTVQNDIAATLGVKPVIEPAVEVDHRVHFLKEYIRASQARGLVLGISGGQDSALAGKLAQIAVEQLREEGYSANFLALGLPFRKQADEQDRELALEFIHPDDYFQINVEYGVKGVLDEIDYGSSIKISDYHKGNVKARLRAVTQYAIAGHYNLLVVGTDHAAEAVTGFFTKFGDGAADILPLSGLTKRQGKSLLAYLNAPEKLYLKAPTADLLDGVPGQKDEDELGLTYNQIDDYLEGIEVTDEVRQRIETRYRNTEHKRRGPVSATEDRWW